MITFIANKTKQNDKNEIFNECSAKAQIDYAYYDFFEEIKSYMDPNSIKETAQILGWLNMYLDKICANAKNLLKKPQSEVLACSHELVDNGIILPIFVNTKKKKLSEILDLLRRDKCKRFRKGLRNLEKYLSQCPEKTESYLMFILIENMPKMICLENDGTFARNGMNIFMVILI